MTVEVVLLAATTSIAVIAVGVAAAAVRAVRTLERQASQSVVEVATNRGGTSRGEAVGDSKPPVDVVSRVAVPAPTSTTEDRPLELEPKIVHGRVIVPPSQAQVVRTALGRPGVRVSVLAHGLAHALRAENRDRILALMRREY